MRAGLRGDQGRDIGDGGQGGGLVDRSAVGLDAMAGVLDGGDVGDQVKRVWNAIGHSPHDWVAAPDDGSDGRAGRRYSPMERGERDGVRRHLRARRAQVRGGIQGRGDARILDAGRAVRARHARAGAVALRPPQVLPHLGGPVPASGRRVARDDLQVGEGRGSGDLHDLGHRARAGRLHRLHLLGGDARAAVRAAGRRLRHQGGRGARLRQDEEGDDRVRRGRRAARAVKAGAGHRRGEGGERHRLRRAARDRRQGRVGGTRGVQEPAQDGGVRVGMGGRQPSEGAARCAHGQAVRGRGEGGDGGGGLVGAPAGDGGGATGPSGAGGVDGFGALDGGDEAREGGGAGGGARRAGRGGGEAGRGGGKGGEASHRDAAPAGLGRGGEARGRADRGAGDRHALGGGRRGVRSAGCRSAHGGGGGRDGDATRGAREGGLGHRGSLPRGRGSGPHESRRPPALHSRHVFHVPRRL